MQQFISEWIMVVTIVIGGLNKIMTTVKQQNY